MKSHIADAESAPFVVVNIAPDFCEIDGTIIPFDIVQFLSEEHSSYSSIVHARNRKTLKLGSVLRGVVGDAGEGVISGTSQGTGHVLVVEGELNVKIEGIPAARHGHLCLMNGKE